MTIVERLHALDLTLFDAIETQSIEQDKQSWLAMQRVLREPDGYTYLEIGSHLGGSIQQHLLDPLCLSIFSIDKRPLSQPDARGPVYAYEGNSTARMMDNLYRLAGEATSKITCIDKDTNEVTPQELHTPPDFCFIDGEHTQAAATRDFGFCLSVCSHDAVIAFHDAQVIWPAIVTALQHLRLTGIPYTARQFQGMTFAIFLRGCKLASDAWILTHSVEGHEWLVKRANRHGFTLHFASAVHAPHTHP